MAWNKIRCLINPQCTLGEGPVWDNDLQILHWVDILENKIYRYNPKTGDLHFWLTSENVSFISLGKNGNLIAGLKSGLHHIKLHADSTLTATRIDRVDEDQKYIRFNDGMTDHNGGIWACTMDMRLKEPLGKYYYYNQNLQRKIVDKGYVVANGPALSPNMRYLYTVESVGNENLEKGIFVLDIESPRSYKHKKQLIDWSDKKSYPDGVITDKSGNLWVGEFGGNVLRCYYPDGLIKHEIPLPAWNVTKPTFCGINENIIYVTSARTGTNEKILAKYPETGGIIEIKKDVMD